MLLAPSSRKRPQKKGREIHQSLKVPSFPSPGLGSKATSSLLGFVVLLGSPHITHTATRGRFLKRKGYLRTPTFKAGRILPPLGSQAFEIFHCLPLVSAPLLLHSTSGLQMCCRPFIHTAPSSESLLRIEPSAFLVSRAQCLAHMRSPPPPPEMVVE